MRRTGRWIGFALLGLLLYVALMCAFAPARYFALIVAHVTQGAIHIDETAGSFWDGSGNLHQGQQALGTLHWTIHPLSLLRLALVADWQLEGPDLNLKVSTDLGWGRYSLRDVELTASANAIGTFYPPARLFGVSGQIHANAAALNVTRDGIDGKALVKVGNAASRMLPVNPLGDYALTATGNGKQVKLDLATERGALQAVGAGQWNAFGDGLLHMEGTFVSTASQDQLEQMLNMFGPLQADGKHHFKVDQRLLPIDAKTIFP